MFSCVASTDSMVAVGIDLHVKLLVGHKKPMKKVSEAHFQKVLKRQKSANSTKRCSNDNLKSAQTTIFYKTLYFNRKSFCNILGAE